MRRGTTDAIVVAGLREHLVEAVEMDDLADFGKVVLEAVEGDVKNQLLGGAHGKPSIGKRRCFDPMPKVSSSFYESPDELVVGVRSRYMRERVDERLEVRWLVECHLPVIEYGGELEPEVVSRSRTDAERAVRSALA